MVRAANHVELDSQKHGHAEGCIEEEYRVGIGDIWTQK